MGLQVNVYNPVVEGPLSEHPLYPHLNEVISYCESRFRAIIPVIASLPLEKLTTKTEMLEMLRKEVKFAMRHVGIASSLSLAITIPIVTRSLAYRFLFANTEDVTFSDELLDMIAEYPSELDPKGEYVVVSDYTLNWWKDGHCKSTYLDDFNLQICLQDHRKYKTLMLEDTSEKQHHYADKYTAPEAQDEHNEQPLPNPHCQYCRKLKAICFVTITKLQSICEYADGIFASSSHADNDMASLLKVAAGEIFNRVLSTSAEDYKDICNMLPSALAAEASCYDIPSPQDWEMEWSAFESAFLTDNTPDVLPAHSQRFIGHMDPPYPEEFESSSDSTDENEPSPRNDLPAHSQCSIGHVDPPCPEEFESSSDNADEDSCRGKSKDSPSEAIPANMTILVAADTTSKRRRLNKFANSPTRKSVGSLNNNESSPRNVLRPYPEEFESSSDSADKDSCRGESKDSPSDGVLLQSSVQEMGIVSCSEDETSSVVMPPRPEEFEDSDSDIYG